MLLARSTMGAIAVMDGPGDGTERGSGGPLDAAPDDRDALPPGTRIGAYRIDHLIGVGGMGRVYRARSLPCDHVVALKLPRDERAPDGRTSERVWREAEVLATLAHPGVPRLLARGALPGGRPWLAMELVAGEPLSRALAGAALPASAVIELVGGIAGVLAAAHARGIAHLDLTPDNVLVTPRDPAYPLRVIDWGIASVRGIARDGLENDAIGTPAYMAPELARGGLIDGHSDVYALGIVAYEALTGRPPFLGATWVEVLTKHLTRAAPALAPRCPDAPARLVALVERMLEKDHRHRPDAREVQASLACMAIDAGPPAWPPVAAAGRRRRPPQASGSQRLTSSSMSIP